MAGTVIAAPEGAGRGPSNSRTMSLRTLLQELILDDAQGAAIGTMDGTIVESVVRRAEADPLRVAADLATLLKVAAYSARKLDGGDLDSVALSTERLAILAVALTPQHYLAIVLKAGGNVARARLAVRKRRADLIELLS